MQGSVRRSILFVIIYVGAKNDGSFDHASLQELSGVENAQAHQTFLPRLIQPAPQFHDTPVVSAGRLASRPEAPG